MLDLLATILIITSVDLPYYPAWLRSHIVSAAVSMELADADEFTSPAVDQFETDSPEYWASRQSTRVCLDIIRHRYSQYGAYPPVSDLARFAIYPDSEIVARASWFRDCRLHAEKMAVLYRYPDWGEAAKVLWRLETGTSSILTARSSNRNHMKRDWLEYARQLLGNEMYYAGELP